MSETTYRPSQEVATIAQAITRQESPSPTHLVPSNVSRAAHIAAANTENALNRDLTLDGLAEVFGVAIEDAAQKDPNRAKYMVPRLSATEREAKGIDPEVPDALIHEVKRAVASIFPESEAHQPIERVAYVAMSEVFGTPGIPPHDLRDAVKSRLSAYPLFNREQSMRPSQIATLGAALALSHYVTKSWVEASAGHQVNSHRAETETVELLPGLVLPKAKHDAIRADYDKNMAEIRAAERDAILQANNIVITG